ncbi:MAG: MFS transporter [Steroidobacteraceae bacterium]
MSSKSHISFAALRHRGFRFFFVASMSAMLADYVEHVISYWVMYQKFHSRALLGFAVVSHWVPFLLFSAWSGAQAERRDPRRLIQIGMALFMGVSLAWGVLFYTNTLQIWHAMLLLSIHGIAGVFWTPSAQLLVYDIVGPADLQSAVRLTATARYLGTLLGPAIGSVLMLWLGPVAGIMCNAAIYLPMLLWLWKAPYGPAFRAAGNAPRAALHGFAEIFATLRTVAGNRTLLSMVLLAGLVSLFIGTSYQAQMPGFALALGHGDPGIAYSALLGADAAGALLGAALLESFGLLQPRPALALVLGTLWCVALAGFAITTHYTLALLLMFAAGFIELSFSSMAQTLVQLNAPTEIRGAVIGVFAMAALGMRTFSGLTVGVLGELIGIHWSLGLSAAALGLCLLVLMFYVRQPWRPAPAGAT